MGAIYKNGHWYMTNDIPSQFTVKTGGFGGMTGSDTLATFSMGIPPSRYVIIGYRLSSDYIALPFIDSNGNQAFHCFTYTAANGFKPVPSTSISGTYYYIDAE